jgi:hypothetical protein
MKANNTMTKKWLACGVAALLLGSATLVAAADVETVVRGAPSANGVTYVSGGVGNESIDRLNAMSGEFNVKLIFAMNSGEYVSGVKVVIVDSKERTLVDAVSDGPWFFSKLPAGRYQVVASLAGKAEKRQLVVGESKLMTVDFRWAER